MKKIAFTFILIGTIGLAINMIFGTNTVVFLTKVRISDQLFAYRFDTWGYIQNIKDSFTDVSVLVLELPTRHWIAVESLADLGNNLAVILDYILLIINILLYPIRVGGYFLKNTLAFLGINVVDQAAAGGIQWLVNFTRILTNIQIPYI